MPNPNIAAALEAMAARAPYRTAIIAPVGSRKPVARPAFEQLSFAQLDKLCSEYARGFQRYGITQGERTLLLIRPGIDLIAVVFALFKLGAVPIIIDPGMGRKAFLQCVAETEPTAMIGIPLAHALRKVFPRPFRTIKRAVTVGRRWAWGGATLDELRHWRGVTDGKPFPVVESGWTDEAAVAFTSGSTGIPKGVVYEHGMLRTQLDILRDEIGMGEGDVHLVVLPVFALFNPGLGVTTVIANMDARKPATVNPRVLTKAINTHGVTLSFGSPVIWEKVRRSCQRRGVTLDSLRALYMFGAPIYPDLAAGFAEIMPHGTVYTPYGATEALPLTNIDHRDIATTAQATLDGAGVCVGRVLGDGEVRIIPISDEIIERWDESLALPVGEIGEIVARGSVVTRSYLHRPQKTAQAKIYADDEGGDKRVWHRMGDVGYLDDAGRVWVLGRLSHRVQTHDGLLTPIATEVIFNQHPAVRRTALVGMGERIVASTGNATTGSWQEPVLVVEMTAGVPSSAGERQRIVAELLALGAQHAHTRAIQTVLFHPDFPVDVRHNAKIKRELLAEWAAKELAVDLSFRANARNL